MSGMIIFFRLFALFIFLTFFFSLAESSPALFPSVCAPPFPSDALIEWNCYRIKKGDTIEGLFGKHREAVLRFNRIDQRHLFTGKTLKVPRNLDAIASFTPLPSLLPQAVSYEKYIFVNLKEQFLGAYRYGNLIFSFPIASGRGGSTPQGMFRVMGRDRQHRSSLYTIDKTNIPYPMFWAIKFYRSKKGVAFWLHSRDMPGYPASHGCIGLYDETMQKRFYGAPAEPMLHDAKKLYLWLFPDGEYDERSQEYPKNAPIIPIEII